MGGTATWDLSLISYNEKNKRKDVFIPLSCKHDETGIWNSRCACILQVSSVTQPGVRPPPGEQCGVSHLCNLCSGILGNTLYICEVLSACGFTLPATGWLEVVCSSWCCFKSSTLFTATGSKEEVKQYRSLMTVVLWNPRWLPVMLVTWKISAWEVS